MSIGGDAARATVDEFVDSGIDRHTLGLVYGRRRIGKSTMLDRLVTEHDGFHWEATRTEPAVQLARLGTELGEHLGVGPLALDSCGQARLILCGSAIAVLAALTAGQAPLRGRAGVELVMQPHDFRAAATWVPGRDRILAMQTFAVIGGVIGYATDMVDHDLPESVDDFGRWIARRVLSPRQRCPALRRLIAGQSAASQSAITAATASSRPLRSWPLPSTQ